MSVYDTNNDVKSRITDVTSFVNTQLAAAEAFMSTLQTLADLRAPFLTIDGAKFTPEAPDLVPDFKPTTSTSKIESAIRDVEAAEQNIADPDIASFGELDVDMREGEIETAIGDIDRAGADLEAPSLVDNYGDLDVQFPVDEAADIQSPTAEDFNFTEEEYKSALLDKLKGKIAGDIEGGTGLSPEVEAAIWQRDEGRRSLALQEAIDAVTDEWTARGFSMPDGVLQDAVAAVVEKDKMDRDSRSRDIMIKQAELAQANVQSAITNGVNLEGVLVAHHDRVMDRSLAAAQAVITVGIAIMEAQLKRIVALIDAKKSELEAKISVERHKLDRYLAAVQVFSKKVEAALGKVRAYTEIGQSELQAKIAVEKFKLDKYLANVQVFAKKVEAALGKVRGYTDLYGVEADVYRTALTKAEMYAKLAISQNQLSLENAQSNLQLALEAAKTNLQTFISTAQLRGQVAQAGAQVYGSAVAAAQNSINTVIQLASAGLHTLSEG